MTTYSHPFLCLWCTHFNGPAFSEEEGLKLTCKAFPDGIPEKIIDNLEDHRIPVDGDNGVTFEPRQPFWDRRGKQIMIPVLNINKVTIVPADR